LTRLPICAPNGARARGRPAEEIVMAAAMAGSAGPPGSVQTGRTGREGASALSRVGPQRGRLRDALVTFRALVAQDDDGEPARWRSAVAAALDELADAWHEHVEFTEAPDGLFDELLDASVEVAADVDHLRRDHLAVAAAIERARDLLTAPGAGPADARLEQALGAVAKQVEQHRRRGADLLYRVYSVDVSAGD